MSGTKKRTKLLDCVTSDSCSGLNIERFNNVVQHVVCLLSGVGAMTWSPLACGLLTGKYNEGVPESSRAAMKVQFPAHCQIKGPKHFTQLL